MPVIFPSSKDIYFEIEGRKVAIVQSYNTSYQRDDKQIDAFGESESVGYTFGKRNHTIKIKKAYIDNAAYKDGFNFYTLDNFSFVIIKPDRRIVYTGCSIQNVEEDGGLNEVIAENITIRATSRREDPR